MDWSDFKLCRHPLKRPLLIATGPQGSLACGYLNVETFEKLGEAVAIVRGVDDFDAMRSATVQAISSEAAALGIAPGMTGEQALALLR